MFGLIDVHSDKATQLYNKQTQIKKLNTDIEVIKGQKAATDKQVQERDKKLQEVQQQIDNLNKQLQAKKDKESLIEKVISPFTPQIASAYEGCGDNQYAAFIYQHESGCNIYAKNAGGCLGIGQACPGSKLLAVCPDLNYACQNSFFTAYANSAYGGWYGAYNAWLSKGWW